MLDERKTAILRAVVREYIETAQPVGSTHIADAPGVRVSSATVRNEMAVLEQEGFLTQPHTSAGRIPTDKGYRFFVDHLTEPGSLDGARREQVGDFFNRTHGALERMLQDTSRLLSELTDYAAVVVGPASQAAVVRSVQLTALSARVVMVVVVLSNGSVEHETIESDEDVAELTVTTVAGHLQRQLIGRPLAELASVPTLGTPHCDSLLATVGAAFGPTVGDGGPVYVGGAATMARAFDAVEVVRRVLNALEQQFVVVSLVRDVLDRGLSVAIGVEHGVEPFAACSVVVAPVRVGGEDLGTIGVLGPTRMNYPQALAAVEVVSDRLGRRLAES